jgi:signal transduction histidine kinase
MTNRFRKLLKQLLRSLDLPTPEIAHRLARVQAIERNLVLPLKVFMIGVVLFSLHNTPWFGLPLGSLEVAVTTITTIFAVYLAINAAAAVILVASSRAPFALVQWSVFALSLADGVIVGALVFVSGGYDSPLFWLFVLLIIRNAASHPPVWSQLVLNLGTCVCFAVACVLASSLNEQLAEELYGRPVPQFHRSGSRTNHVANASHPHTNNAPPPPPVPIDDSDSDLVILPVREGGTEPIVIRLIVLALGSVWLYGVQVLLEKQRLAGEEAREFSAREDQLRSAGRLAAEFAHQIKNPLAIINNATFSLERGLKTGKGDPQRHIHIIQEEVSRADRIITQVMGYAELTEGRVEKLDLTEEIQRAIRQIFPDGLPHIITVELDLRGPFPPMLMQRRHLAEIFLNLLQNAREALGGEGKIVITARVRRDLAVEVVVADNGPGIPPDKLGRIFEAYFTTKERGTGLGLAIVKNNTELYGGTAHAESELGKGARFTLVFPAKASVKLVS